MERQGEKGGIRIDRVSDREKRGETRRDRERYRER